MLSLPSAFFCPSRLLIPSIMPLLHLHSPSSNPSSPLNLSSIPPTRLYSSSPALCAPPNISSISFQVASCSALKVIRRSAESFTSLTAFKMQSKSGTAHSSSFSTSSSSTQVISVSDSEGTVKEVIGKSPVVSVSWLHQHLRDPNLKVLDASWYMPAEKRHPLKEFKGLHIPGSLFFDLEAISDVTSDLPHMLPSEGAFSAAMSALGITNEDAVIIYDGNGIFSAARVWWMFRVFGHKNVSVLDGGLPQWCQFGFPLDTVTSQAELEKIEAAALAVKNFYQGQQVPTGNFKASLQKDLVWSSEQVMKNLEDETFQHIDARTKARLHVIFLLVSYCTHK
ncbi:hypothetical protein O6H91_13G088200 [Diphasiastrum complanatum]|uniref:Uncharacterized protein n=1 Tax=Diphasiastrum complanatum TaxID=34168 RepID=A0ACC2BX57_DIPCM|nr:hypothetical protein O6H91_13G088200 [Diphasiastrum complanatum]